MSLYKDASLAMIPSAYKDGKLYSIRPTDGSGDFTFSRGSNLAATRVDVNGLIEKGRENILLQSNQFDTTWSKSSTITITGGQSGYDGSNNAWLITKTSAISYQGIRQSLSTSGVQTASIYAKAGTLNTLAVYIDGGSRPYVAVNLSNGTFTGQRGTEIDFNIQDVANGWYRISFAFNESSSDYWIYPDWSETNTGTIYIQDAQLEQGLVATDYIETGASTAQAGILEDMPRLDYSGGASCPSLLLEPQRSNIIVQSEYFGANDWLKSNATITDNNSTSPEGVQNASLLTITSAIGNIYDNVGGTGDYTFSVFAKYVDMQYIRLRSTGTYVYFDIQNGSVEQELNGTGSIEDYGNGWYRCSVTGNNTNSLVQIFLSDTEGGTPTGTGSVLIYGAQFESGSYPTSYIPTYGSSVTRSVDSCVATSVSDLIGQKQGTMFVDITINNISGQTNDPIPLSLKGSGSTNSYISIYDNGRVQAVHYGFGSVQGNINLPTYGLTDGRHKFAFVYRDNDFKLFIDGALAGSDTSGLVDAQSDVHIGYYNTAFNGAIKNHQSLIFPTALTDSECIALTTL